MAQVRGGNDAAIAGSRLLAGPMQSAIRIIDGAGVSRLGSVASEQAADIAITVSQAVERNNVIVPP
jgi:hypothetical protein